MKIQDGQMSGAPFFMSRLQTVRRNAYSMCTDVHLQVWKKLDMKLLTFYTKRYSSNLRAPDNQEAIEADQEMWTSIFKLVNEEGWHLNEATHEISEIRQDLRTLMQPRPATTMKGSKGTQGRGKGKGGTTHTTQRVQAVSSQQETKGTKGGKKGKGKYNDKRTSGKGGGDMPKNWATEVRWGPDMQKIPYRLVPVHRLQVQSSLPSLYT